MTRLGIRPETAGLSQAFWDGARRHELLLQRCSACGRHWHPPSEFCPHCRSSTWAWVAAAGGGTIYSFTVVHHAVHPVLADRLPYTVVLVDLDEGARVVARSPGAQPEIGRRVTRGLADYDEISLPELAAADGG